MNVIHIISEDIRKTGLVGVVSRMSAKFGVTNGIVYRRRLSSYYAKLNDGEIRAELSEWFKRASGKELNWDNMQTFDEKIQWMKLYDCTPLKTQLADKYLVREYVENMAGGGC